MQQKIENIEIKLKKKRNLKIERKMK